MNKFFVIFIVSFFLFNSEKTFSQTVKILEKRAKNQIVNGINVSPVNKKIKAVPVSVKNHSNKNLKVGVKTKRKEKPKKVSKYNVNKKRNDE